MYDFISQVINYGPDAEKRANFYRLLARLIVGDGDRADDIDLSDVHLRTVVQVAGEVQDISLTGEDAGLQGITGAGSSAKKDPKYVALGEVIDRLNELFGDAFTVGQKQTFVDGLINTLLGDDALVEQARANTRKQFLEKPRLTKGVQGAVNDNQGAHNQMADVFYGDNEVHNEIVRLVGALLYEWVRDESQANPGV